MAFVLGLTVVAFAGNADKSSSTDSPKELKHQTVCPVMGGKIDSTQYTDIQGQRVYHCCPMCSAKLIANPDKYFKKAAEEGVLFENIQTNCPVSGEKLKTKDVYTDFEGRRIYFCCKDCVKDFNDDPMHYLHLMGKGTTTEPKKMKEMDHDMGHKMEQKKDQGSDTDQNH
jgi:YHS domain-containing protein